MNSIQSALQAALPQAMEQIRKEARKAAFERAAVRGSQLMLEATVATRDGDLRRALAAVRKDRYACACYLAKALKRPVPQGFSELELMEQLWAEKAKEQEARRKAAEAETKAKKALVEAEVAAIRRMAQKPLAVVA